MVEESEKSWRIIVIIICREHVASLKKQNSWFEIEEVF